MHVLRATALSIVSGLVLASGAIAQPSAPAPEPAPTPPAAAAAQPTDLSDLLPPILAKHNVPGMVVAVVSGDQIVATGVAGVRKRGDDTKATLDDQWHIGSCTKSMTATLIGTLVEEGKLKWSTTLADVFPDLVASGAMQPDWKPVTLRQLLTHRAGVPTDLSGNGLWGRLWQNAGAPGPEQRTMLLEGVLSQKPAHPPGTKYEYANAGFAIAGAMAEKVTGQAWEDLLRTRVFDRLGMASAAYGAPGTNGSSPPDQPRGHHDNGQPEEPGLHADNPAAIGPGGTVRCTISDWARYVSLHLRADRANPHRECRLLKPETFDMLHAVPEGLGPGEPTYAMGWSISTRPWAKGNAPGSTGSVLTHNGSNTMWFAVCWLAPERDFAVLAMCNQGGSEADKACDEAVWGAIQQHIKGPQAEATGKQPRNEKK